MLQSIDIAHMVLLFLIGIAISMLGMAFQAFMRPGQIFNWYAIWLENIVNQSLTKRIVPKRKVTPCGIEYTKDYKPQRWYIILLAKLSKPLGLCPYCNSTWIAIIFYVIFFGIGFDLFLLIGIVWFFVKMIIIKTEPNNEE